MESDEESTSPAGARDYLAAWLADEAEWDPSDSERIEFFTRFAEFVRSLPESDPRLSAAANALGPIFEDEERLPTAVYDSGAFVQATETWGGDFDAFFSHLIQELERDASWWAELLRLRGDEAEWEPPSDAWSPAG